MFKSQLSGKLVGPKVSPVKVVTEKRRVKYRNIVDKKEVLSEGWEIVKEITVSPDEAAGLKKSLGE